MAKFGFIGIGKIASAVVEGFCTSQLKELEIFVSPRGEQNSILLAEKFPKVTRLNSNQEVLDHSETIFLAVKPDQIVTVLKELSFRPTHQVISFIPFLEHQELLELIKPASNASRTIPLPSVVNHNCPIPIFGGDEKISKLMAYIGQPLKLAEEGQLHIIWTLTGLISPFYDLMGNLSNWAIEKGVNPAVANQYTADLFQSLAFTAQKINHLDFEKLSWHAATPNGLNEQASKELIEAGVHDSFRITCDHIMQRISNKE